jgi:hypothetical protein
VLCCAALCRYAEQARLLEQKLAKQKSKPGKGPDEEVRHLQDLLVFSMFLLVFGHMGPTFSP